MKILINTKDIEGKMTGGLQYNFKFIHHFFNLPNYPKGGAIIYIKSYDSYFTVKTKDLNMGEFCNLYDISVDNLEKIQIGEESYVEFEEISVNKSIMTAEVEEIDFGKDCGGKIIHNIIKAKE